MSEWFQYATRELRICKMKKSTIYELRAASLVIRDSTIVSSQAWVQRRIQDSVKHLRGSFLQK